MFCKKCGAEMGINENICPKCGTVQSQQPQIVINNANANTNVNQAAGYGPRPKDKWVAFFLCLFLGPVGAHKFYEGKTGMGILYLFTFGLFCIGWVVDTIVILTKPNPYYV